MCLVLAHMYIKCISVYTRAIHAIKQSITVTIIDNIHVSFFRVLAPFYFHFFPLLVPISCRCVQELKKREGGTCDYHSLTFEGFVDIL